MSRFTAMNVRVLWFTGTLLLALCGVAAVTPGVTPAVRAAPLQQSNVTLVKTVGLKPGECASTTEVDITAGLTVTYCYALTNSSGASILAQTLLDSDGQSGQTIVAWSASGSALVGPGATLRAYRTVPDAVTPNPITADTTGNAIWTIQASSAAYSIESNQTTVRVVKPSIQVTLTVGAVIGCSSAGASLSTGATNTAYYCVKVQNTSSVTLTNHEVSVPTLGLFVPTLAFPLAPSAVMVLTASNTNPAVQLPELAQPPSKPTLISTAYVSSKTAGGIATSGASSPVTVTVPASFTFVKYIATEPDQCPNQVTVQINRGAAVYYCLVVGSTNAFTFTHQAFTEPANGIAASFQVILPPNGRITFTSQSLAALGITNALGPIYPSVTANGVTMNYTTTNPSYNYAASAQGATNVTVVQPTPTIVQSAPINTPWPTSVFPSTPTWTPPPVPPTLPPTLAPTISPIPTPTMIVFSTPGGLAPTAYPTIGLGGVGPAQGVPQPGVNPVPLDPAAAATATTMALYGYVAPGTDPLVALTAAAATATTAALFANPALGLDPAAAATATTMVLNGLVAPGTDPRVALATAAAIYGTPVPAIDPAAAATATMMVLNGLAAPGTDPRVALATAAAIYGAPVPAIDPAAAATATTMVLNGLVAPGTDPQVALATAAAIYGTPVPAIDPAAAATATTMVLNGLVAPGTDPQAALATAAALYGAPTPAIDPAAAATATMMVVNGLVAPGTDPQVALATAAAIYGTPAPAIDPAAAATATMLVVNGLVAPGTDPQVALATAAALYGAPTPVIDPAGAATATMMVVNGLVAPGTDPQVALATAAALYNTQAPTSPLAAPLPPPPIVSSGAESAPPSQSPPSNEAFGLFTRILESAGATLTLIWFLVGSLVFFITAGVLAGLSFRRATQERYTVQDSGAPPTYELDDTPMQPTDDDIWPSSLP